MNYSSTKVCKKSQGKSAWRVRFVAAFVFGLLTHGHVRADTILGTVSQDFDSAGDTFATYLNATAPVAGATGNAAQLTDTVNGQNGRISFAQTVAGAAYDKVIASFDFRLQPDTG